MSTNRMNQGHTAPFSVQTVTDPRGVEYGFQYLIKDARGAVVATSELKEFADLIARKLTA